MFKPVTIGCFVALLVSAPATAQGKNTILASAPVTSITVGLQHYGMCAGLCPCFETTIYSNGYGTTRSCDPFMSNARNVDFHVTNIEARRFASEVLPLKKIGVNARTCTPGHNVLFLTKVVWISNNPTLTLTCNYGQVYRPLERAFTAIGIGFYDGHVLTTKQRRFVDDKLKKNEYF